MIDIRTLRAAGLTDVQILKVIEEDQAKRREQNRKAQIKHRSRQHDIAYGADRGDIEISPISKSFSTESSLEISLVALATPAVPKYPAEFERFYSTYPRHTGKDAALKAWRRAITKTSNAELIAGAERYRDDANREAQFTKHPATWLNAGCHADEPLPRKAQGNGQGRRHGSVLDACDRLKEKLNAQGSFADEYIPGTSGPTPLRLDQEMRPANLRIVSKG